MVSESEAGCFDLSMIGIVHAGRFLTIKICSIPRKKRDSLFPRWMYLQIWFALRIMVISDRATQRDWCFRSTRQCLWHFLSIGCFLRKEVYLWNVSVVANEVASPSQPAGCHWQPPSLRDLLDPWVNNGARFTFVFRALFLLGVGKWELFRELLVAKPHGSWKLIYWNNVLS